MSAALWRKQSPGLVSLGSVITWAAAAWAKLVFGAAETERGSEEGPCFSELKQEPSERKRYCMWLP